MKQASLHFLIAIIATASAFADDTVVFKNGDVLTGTILQQDAEHVQFQSEAFGSVSLNVADIAELRKESPEQTGAAVPTEAPTPQPEPTPNPESATQEAVDLSKLYSDLFSSETASQTASTPEPATATEPQTAVAQAPSTPPPAAPPPAAVPLKAPSKWTGQAGLAIAMREKTYSNSAGVYKEEKFETYRLYGHVNWKGKKNNLNWNWNYRYSEDEDRIRDDYFNITQKYNHTLKGGYYAEAKTVYQRDYNRRIDNEYLQTAEMGKKWFQNPRFKFSTSIGGGYHAYERTKSEPTTVSEPKFIFDESLEWMLVNSLTLFQKYTHLGSLENYHFVFSSGLENKLIRELFLRLEYRIDNDTDTTYHDNGYYDKAFLTSLLYKF